jgi:hypothetical protein
VQWSLLVPRQCDKSPVEADSPWSRGDTWVQVPVGAPAHKAIPNRIMCFVIWTKAPLFCLVMGPHQQGIGVGKTGDGGKNQPTG